MGRRIPSGLRGLDGLPFLPDDLLMDSGVRLGQAN
jgi:hypothetical protein